MTATEVEKAEREQRLAVIAAEQEAQQRRISEQNVVELDVFRRKRQAEIARQAADLEAESIRTLAQANRDKALAEAEGKRAVFEAENALNDAKLSAKLIRKIWPSIAPQLPEILKALAPQPGVLGDTRIYSFPGANNGNGAGDINKMLLSTSGLASINTLLKEGKLGTLLSGVSQLLRSNGTIATDSQPEDSDVRSTTKPPAPTPAPPVALHQSTAVPENQETPITIEEEAQSAAVTQTDRARNLIP